MSKKHGKTKEAKRKKTTEKPAKKNGKPSKGKKERTVDAVNVCPCCKKHCSLHSPKCGKGKKLAKKLRLAADS